MSDVKYFRPRNWRKHQTYKRANPPFIRNSTALLNDYKYGKLEPQQRALLHGLWLLTARTGRAQPWDSAWIAKELRLNTQLVAKGLPILERNNFIELCDKSWKDRSKTEPPETETETETDTVPSEQPATPPAEVDLKSQIFGQGLVWLQNRTGRAESSLRSFLGQACKQVGDGVVLETLIAAARADPVDPLSWVRAECQRRARAAPQTETGLPGQLEELIRQSQQELADGLSNKDGTARRANGGDPAASNVVSAPVPTKARGR